MPIQQAESVDTLLAMLHSESADGNDAQQSGGTRPHEASHINNKTWKREYQAAMAAAAVGWSLVFVCFTFLGLKYYLEVSCRASPEAQLEMSYNLLSEHSPPE